MSAETETIVPEDGAGEKPRDLLSEAQGAVTQIVERDYGATLGGWDGLDSEPFLSSTVLDEEDIRIGIVRAYLDGSYLLQLDPHTVVGNVLSEGTPAQ